MNRGLRNNNPLNIRIGNNWIGERTPKKDPLFEEFNSLEYGIRAAFIILLKYITKYKRNTIEKIIRSWAPPSENNTNLYITTVESITGINRHVEIKASDEKKIKALVDAMIFVECGVHLLPEIINSAWNMMKTK